MQKQKICLLFFSFPFHQESSGQTIRQLLVVKYVKFMMPFFWWLVRSPMKNEVVLLGMPTCKDHGASMATIWPCRMHWQAANPRPQGSGRGLSLTFSAAALATASSHACNCKSAMQGRISTPYVWSTHDNGVNGSDEGSVQRICNIYYYKV